MRWESERWIKLYTRDTPEWAMLPLEARCVFLLSMRIADRSGTIQLGAHGLKALAKAIDAPLDFVNSGISALVADGCVCIDGPVLHIKNFEKAQETRTSDAERKRRSRESQQVTASHTKSQPVTLGHDKTRQEENRIDETRLEGGSKGGRNPADASTAPPDSGNPPPKKAKREGKRKKPSTPCPDPNTTDPAELEQWCTANKIPWPLTGEARHFLNNHTAKGNTFVSWPAAWQTWQANGKKFSNGSNGMRGKVQPPRDGALPWNPDYV